MCVIGSQRACRGARGPPQQKRRGAATAITLAYAANAEWNDSRWNNPRFEELLKLARAELEDDKRRAMHGEMQMMLHDQGGAVIPAFAAYLQAHNGKIASDRIATNYPLDGFRLTERWWRL